MNTEKMREAFEAWVVFEFASPSLRRYNPLHGVTEGDYTDVTIRSCWKAWQASRAAVVIELPDSNSKHNAEVIKAVGRHMLAQSLKVKP